MDVSYTRDTEVNFEKAANSSKLAKPVQDLIKLIFDVKAMKQSLAEFDLDLEKMPLGKLSNEQLKRAYQILSDLTRHVKDDKKTLISDCTTQFYHLVPHALKDREQLPLLDHEDIIKTKTQMVDSLLEIEQAYQMLNESDAAKDENENPIDVSYAKLKTELGVLDKGKSSTESNCSLIKQNSDCTEFKMIEKYVKNTHAKTHTNYKLVINNVYTVKRKNEHKKFRPFG